MCEEVRVIAEKPLVKRDATNTKRVVSAEVIESLPLRSVDNIVGLQAGVVDNHVRGGRSGDTAYYVDGVLMKDHWAGSNATGGLSQAGMEQISLEAGGFGAEYGGANGGIINVTSKSGSQKISGSAESVFDIGDSILQRSFFDLFNLLFERCNLFFCIGWVWLLYLEGKKG